MRNRLAPLIASVAMLTGGVAYIWLWATTPASCATVGVRSEDWIAGGVRVHVTGECSLQQGDLVTAIDRRPLVDGAAAGSWPTGSTVEISVIRDGSDLTLPLSLVRPDLAAALGPAWPTLLFVTLLFAVAGYVVWRRPSSATYALLILACGLGVSSLPTLLGLPVTAVPDPWLRWLHLALTQIVYIAGWCGGLAFNLQFPRPYGRPEGWGSVGRLALYTAPLWITAGWSAFAGLSSVDVLEWIGRTIAGGAIVIVTTILVMAGVGVSRLRRTRDALERQQIRWLAGTGTLALAAGLAGWFLPEVLVGDGLPTRWIGLAALPFVIGLGIAVSRHRLFDLDVVLNRGLVYGLLTTGIVTIYLVVVWLASSLTRERSTTTASIIATAVVAVAVNPLRVVLQRGVSRLMYGDRDEPYSAMRRLDHRLDDAAGLDRLLPAMAKDIGDALRVPYIAIEIFPADRFVEAGTKPRWLADDGLLELPLTDRGERIGRLRVAPRAPGEPFSRADRRLLADLTRRVSAAAREVTLRADLQHSRERLVLAREEERRRLRRALHDELGPAVAGLGLRTEAARRLVGNDPIGADVALAAVRDGTASLVTDIRRLAYDLRPPALDELGLAGALRQYTGAIDHPNVTVTAAGDLGGLPAAVEAAAYRIAVEAVANVVRHANATHCSILLGISYGSLKLRITDDGSGLPRDLHRGVGMAAMSERAAELGGSFHIDSQPAGGSAVIATLPVRG